MNNEDYLYCLNAAREMKSSGEILNFLVENCPRKGRVIYLETTSGWNPNPFYADEPEIFLDDY